MTAPLSPAALPPEDVQEALTLARRVAQNAHAPYSGFHVGAALLDADGGLWSGCNVECASYGLTVCAERTALVKAVSEGVRSFRMLALVTSADEPLMPCGACRQLLFELAPELVVVAAGAGGAQREARLDQLLPQAFGPADLAAPHSEGRDGGRA